MGYENGAAFKRAIHAATKTMKSNRDRALSDVYMDRFLCRVFSEEDPRFILKGGQSIVAQAISTRRTKDIDLLSRETDIDYAISELKRIGEIDLDDLLLYRVERKEPLSKHSEYSEGFRIVFQIFLDGMPQKEKISIDLVARPVSSEKSVSISPENRIELDGVPSYDYQVYPIEFTLVDKTCAIVESHANGLPSSRIKDLADMVAILLWKDLDLSMLSDQMVLEKSLRKIPRTMSFAVPGIWFEGIWPEAYAKVAKESGLPAEYQTIGSAAEFVTEHMKGVFESA